MVLLGWAMYGTMSSFVKLSYSRGYNAAELSFSQAFLTALFLGIILLVSSYKTERRKLSPNELVSLLFAGSTIGLINFLYYQSVSYISASLATVILMNFTWFSLLLEWAIFRNKPSRFEGLTVLFILIGSVLAGNLIQGGALLLSW